jgi:hypothetical protein
MIALCRGQANNLALKILNASTPPEIDAVLRHPARSDRRLVHVSTARPRAGNRRARAYLGRGRKGDYGRTIVALKLLTLSHTLPSASFAHSRLNHASLKLELIALRHQGPSCSDTGTRSGAESWLRFATNPLDAIAPSTRCTSTDGRRQSCGEHTKSPWQHGFIAAMASARSCE